MNLGIKLLVAEDDPNMGNIIKVFLTQKGFTVFLAIDGQMALDYFHQNDVDACLLDVMMPIKDGFIVAKEIRRVNKRIPIIFLTAKSLEADKLKGFNIGADDYITKPFSLEELLARLNASLRRSFDENKPENNVISFGQCVFDYNHQTLTTNKAVHSLTSKECELLKLFALNFNQVVERQEALNRIWKDDSIFAGRSMDVYIVRLRKMLKDDPTIQLKNKPRVGFMLCPAF